MITPTEYKMLCNPQEAKHKNKITIIDGIRFHSKKEAEYYQKLKDQQSKGEIARFHRQILFDLPGGIKHYCDFMVIYHDPHYHIDYIEYHEVKGRDLPLGRLKRKQCEQLYEIEIKLI